MSETKTFLLPDLGEGLPDATIVEWLAREGEVVMLDAPLVSMETAKAVVEVPSPFSGRLVKLHGQAGDVIETGRALAEFEIDATLPQRAAGHDTGHGHGHAPAPTPSKVVTSPAPIATPAPAKTERADQGSVVGAMEASDRVGGDVLVASGGVKAMPAVRALAKKLGVDLTRVRPTGPGGVATLQDVKAAATAGSAAGPAPVAAVASTRAPLAAGVPEASASKTVLSAAGKPIRTTPPSVTASGQPEQLKGVRRNMARVMAEAHAQVVPTTLVDDADIHAWTPGTDVTVRLVRAIVAACRVVPALNAWFDGANLMRTLHPRVDLGIAVDTDDGLFVPALRNADMLDAAGIRAGIERLRAQVADRSIPSSELSGYTISLSNFGMFAGRYATPVVVPPCVAIVGAGRLRHQVVPVMGGIETHRVIPISLTFDHRAATGGEAARFLRAMLDDLARGN
jgi:pyruvate dehydrogenase E2 component (dihydrolipoamide acetyltransferase)